MVVLLVATAAGIAVQLDIDAAHRQYLAADESAGHAEERLRELTADLADATAESTDTHHAIEAVLVIEGDGLDAAARERLALGAVGVHDRAHREPEQQTDTDRRNDRRQHTTDAVHDHACGFVSGNRIVSRIP